MRKRRYFSGGGVPTTGGMYNPAPAQYPFPSERGGPMPPSSSTNTTVNVNGQDVATDQDENPFGPSTEDGPINMRKGGRVKTKSKVKRSRGDGIAERGRTRGKFIR